MPAHNPPCHRACRLLPATPCDPGTPPHAQNRRTLFAQWKAEYKKTYATTAAEAAAFEQFNRTVSSMISHNRNKSSKFWRGGAPRAGRHVRAMPAAGQLLAPVACCGMLQDRTAPPRLFPTQA